MCTTETELSTPETPGDRIEEFESEDPVIRPYEIRALNYLTNEYMLLNDYKLTSVTFAEENENQVKIVIHYLCMICLLQYLIKSTYRLPSCYVESGNK